MLRAGVLPPSKPGVAASVMCARVGTQLLTLHCLCHQTQRQLTSNQMANRGCTHSIPHRLGEGVKRSTCGAEIAAVVVHYYHLHSCSREAGD